jgi:hypothetical protein
MPYAPRGSNRKSEREKMYVLADTMKYSTWNIYPPPL